MYSFLPDGYIKVKDLKPIHSSTTSGTRPWIKRLSDDQLLDSVNHPHNDDPICIHLKTGRVIDGNGRTYELQRRAGDRLSSITFDTKIPFTYYP